MAKWQSRTASDVMTSPATTLHESTSLDEAARTLSDLQISGVPVVGAKGAAVGVVSLFDIVGFLASHEGPVRDADTDFGDADAESDESGERWARSVSRRDRDLLRDTPVSEVMTGEMISVAPTAALGDVVALMQERHIHRVVVAEGDRPLGVVSTLDLLRAVAEG